MEILNRIYRRTYNDIPEKDKQAYEYLLNEGLTLEDIKRDIKKITRLDLVNLDSLEIDSELVKKLNLSEMKKIGIIPIKKENNVIYFATKELLNNNIKRFASKYAIELDSENYEIVYFVLNYDFDRNIEVIHKGIDDENFNIGGNPERDMKINIGSGVSGIFDTERIIKDILEKAFENKASDIHIEPLQEGFHVRYRVDGLLSIIDPFNVSKIQYQSIVNALKIKSDLKVENKRGGQDGKYSDVKHKGVRYDLRLSTIPTVLGEKVVIRVLEKNIKVPSLVDLGFSKFYIQELNRDIKRHHGLILNTGSVGSGKSTTQTTILNSLNAKDINIYSLEDPVEKEE